MASGAVQGRVRSVIARSRATTLIFWILQVLVSVMFLFAGGAKLAGAEAMVQMYNTIGFGQWFRYVTGLIEVGSALLVLVPVLASLGAALLVCTMIGALIAHFTALNSPQTAGGPAFLLVLSLAVLWLRRTEFRLPGSS